MLADHRSCCKARGRLNATTASCAETREAVVAGVMPSWENRFGLAISAGAEMARRLVTYHVIFGLPTFWACPSLTTDN